MNDQLYALLFGLPSFICLVIMTYAAIYYAILTIQYSFKNNDYLHLAKFLTITIVTAILGWLLGSII